jgi:hypothetical protein
MVLTAHLSTKGTRPPSHIPSMDSARTQIIRPARGKESPDLRAIEQPDGRNGIVHMGRAPMTCIKGPSQLSSNDLPTLQHLASGREKTKYGAKILGESTGATDMQVRQAGGGDRSRPTGTTSGDSLPLITQTRQSFIGAGAQMKLSGTSLPCPGIATAYISADLRPRPKPLRRPNAYALPSTRMTNEERHCPKPWNSSTRSRCGPRPPHLPLATAHCATRATAKPLTESKNRIFQIGIETEFVIAHSEETNWIVSLEDFVMTLADNHNEKVPKRHPRMRNFLRPYNFRGDYDKWCWVEDPNLYVRLDWDEPCKPLHSATGKSNSSSVYH